MPRFTSSAPVALEAPNPGTRLRESRCLGGRLWNERAVRKARALGSPDAAASRGSRASQRPDFAPLIAAFCHRARNAGTLRRVPSPAVVPWFVYIVRCADNTLYTGIARDVAARLRAHESGRGARYTRSRGPLLLCAVRRCPSKGHALSLEYSIKQLDRREKQALLQGRRLSAFARACEAKRAAGRAARSRA